MFSKKFLIVAGLLASSTTAFAHITIATGPVQAGKSAKVGLAINHGCNSSTEDTFKILVSFPAGTFSNIRPMRSDFGAWVFVRDAANNNAIIGIEWTKPVEDKRVFDDSYYELTFKATMPNTPYAKVKLDITQTCVNAAGATTTPVHWDDSVAAEPAPRLVIAPARLNTIGWNKITIPASTTVAAADFGAYFGDALIVWKGTAAFSQNPNTTAQIAATTGVTALTDLAAGDEIWVRY
jgi:periplasmic copper chaperone A